jgi:hypothetical protein
LSVGEADHLVRDVQVIAGDYLERALIRRGDAFLQASGVVRDALTYYIFDRSKRWLGKMLAL